MNIKLCRLYSFCCRAHSRIDEEVELYEEIIKRGVIDINLYIAM